MDRGPRPRGPAPRGPRFAPPGRPREAQLHQAPKLRDMGPCQREGLVSGCGPRNEKGDHVFQQKWQHIDIYIYMAVAQKKRYQNETLVSGNMNQNLRNPS